MRLEGLERMSDKQKRELVEAISTDIGAFILCLREHIKAGNVGAETTESFDEVVKLIQGTDVQHRKTLAGKVRHLRKERHWARKEYRRYVRKTEILALGHNRKIQRLKERVMELQAQVVALHGERDLLRLSMEKKQGKENRNEERDEEPENHPSPGGQQAARDLELSTDPDVEWEDEGVKPEGC